MRPYSMNPSEMLTSALVASAEAERDGFTGTAAALILLARAFAEDERELEVLKAAWQQPGIPHSTSARFHNLDIIH
jgi:hypothetical protein